MGGDVLTAVSDEDQSLHRNFLRMPSDVGDVERQADNVRPQEELRKPQTCQAATNLSKWERVQEDGCYHANELADDDYGDSGLLVGPAFGEVPDRETAAVCRYGADYALWHAQ